MGFFDGSSYTEDEEEFQANMAERRKEDDEFDRRASQDDLFGWLFD